MPFLFPTIANENFGYDKNGNKIYEDQNGDIRKYTYDGLNRLTGAEIGNVRTEYEFDNYNNISREYEIIGGRVEKKSYYYDNANRLLLEDSANRTVQYEYDNSGNLIKKITGIGSNAETSYYRYDGYNRLSEFIDDYSTAEYSYNINGLRESKNVNGVKTRYIYNGADIVGEIFDDNIYTYYRATELIGYTNNKGDRYYYRQNSHGDVTALLTVDGQEKKTYSYNAYGKETPFSLAPTGSQTVVQLWKAETEQIHNPFRYCGEYYDLETGFVYLRARMYDPSTGRFISQDPHWNADNMIYGDKEYKEGEKKAPNLEAILQANNLYVYALNNPVRFSDPTGENGGELVLFFPLMALDGPLPIVDVVICTVATIVVLDGIEEASKSDVSVEVDTPKKVKQPVIFTENPNEFKPKGLIKREFSGTHNGRVIKWFIPGTNTAVFEWNEDLNNGPHYHIYHNSPLIESQYHYTAGTPVPEPYASTYFGGI